MLVLSGEPHNIPGLPHYANTLKRARTHARTHTHTHTHIYIYIIHICGRGLEAPALHYQPK